MATIKLSPEVLREVVWDENEDYIKMEEKETGSTRWANIYTMVFRSPDNKYYQVDYRKNTGDAIGERPFEHEVGNVQCFEVAPKEVKIIEYVRV